MRKPSVQSCLLVGNKGKAVHYSAYSYDERRPQVKLNSIWAEPRKIGISISLESFLVPLSNVCAEGMKIGLVCICENDGTDCTLLSTARMMILSSYAIIQKQGAPVFDANHQWFRVVSERCTVVDLTLGAQSGIISSLSPKQRFGIPGFGFTVL